MLAKLRYKTNNIDPTAKSSIKNFLIRPLGMVLAAIYTPLLLDYLGTEANGVWATILSVITWINYCDLGIGNGLRNIMTKELTRKEYEEVQKSVSTAYIVLTVISFILLGALLILSFTLDWNIILNTELNVEPMIVITFIFIILNFVLALSNSMLYALQLSEKVSLRSCLVQVLNIVGLLILRKIGHGNLTYMAILFGSSTAIIYIINTISVMKTHKYLRPQVGLFSKKKIKDICSFGLQFFVIQLTAVMIFSSHNMIVSYLFGAAEVTPVNTVSTVYAAGYSFMAALVIPFWSRTSEAIENGEFQWIRMAMKKVRYISIIFIIGFIIVAILFKDISRVWLGQELNYQPGIILVTCIFYIMEVVNLIYVQFYYGMGDVKPYMWVTIVQAVVMIPLSYVLSVHCGLGVAGVKLAPTILLAISGVVLPFMTNHKLRYHELKWIEKSKV